ncbi:endopygalactorunase [Niabella sp. CC-SYL272]|uniref:endopygalactorunase n=1 Tax=Niabella agricola TaxID=2891571 RepID=UPI001F3B0B37|nr:endopygalactorunase [Niabella agricola]MCF3111809.1 endopygalactorunase [Niabella agricola]
MKCLPILIFSAFLHCMPAGLTAQSPALQNSRYVAGIKKDTVEVVSGSTYAFTADTPEDSGLVATTPSVAAFLADIRQQSYQYTLHSVKGRSLIATGDRLTERCTNGQLRTYYIACVRKALGGQLAAAQKSITVNTITDLTLYFTAGQRSPDATIRIELPSGIQASMEQTTVNIIGRGDVLLKDLEHQSVGRTGAGYPFSKTGVVQILENGRLLLFKHLDLRPSNGPDLKIVLRKVQCTQTGTCIFKARYTTRLPAVLTSADASTSVTVTRTIGDLKRIPAAGLAYHTIPALYTSTVLQWSRSQIPGALIQQSLDSGKTWQPAKATLLLNKGEARLTRLQPNRLYWFRLWVPRGPHKGVSNSVAFYSGAIDVRDWGITGNGLEDNTEQINEAIRYIHGLGGGTLRFSSGTYQVRTVHLLSHVWLYIDKDATIKALKGGDAPEATWYSDKQYRSGLSPTDPGPYENPQNWLTKQDVGHTFFRNAMFHGERADNIKIIGNGYITGNGNLVTSDKVMNNEPDNRSDKMFSLKLCTRVEIGGLHRNEDLWYDSIKDAPYYILPDQKKDFDTGNMLRIDRAGHFVLLATGTDNIHVHDTYFAKEHTSNARDIYDFMSCNNVTVMNIYSKVSSDDIVKPGSDCSLGFTRPAKNYRVRNIIGDTNCNLFQIGSETADDIADICVDNIYVLGANKAGFSISTNDGGHIRNIHLNCGHTGSLHHRSKMLRTYTPFFISISNRGRVLGATAKRFRFREQGVWRDELLVTNVDIGRVENILLNGVDIAEVYNGSSFGKSGTRWMPYDGTQRAATPIIAGYQLPEADQVEGGLPFRLPNGMHTGYIRNIAFNDIQVSVKGGHPASDTTACPPELGVGQYNASNLKVQPSWGLWVRHAQNLTVKNSRFYTEKPDGRYVLYLDDVQHAQLIRIQTPDGTRQRLGYRKVEGLTIE